MEEATKKALDLMEQSVLFARDFIAKHGPQAWDAVLWIYRINGICELLIALLLFVLAAIGWKTWSWCEKQATTRKAERTSHYDDGHLAWLVPGRVILGVSFIAVIFGLIGLFDVWTWVKVFYPDLAVARDVFNKVIK